MSLYSHTSYKDLLKGQLLSKKASISSRYNFSAMARHCGIQKTYLSKVLNHSGHLTSDQLYLCCEYLGLTDKEQAFAFLLFEFERSANLRRKSRIESDLAKIRNSQSKTEGHIQVESPLAARAQVAEWYYLNPVNQLVHIFLTIQEFATSPEKIASRLDITPAELTSILSRLESEGIIMREEGRYRVSRQSMHLPAENSIFPAYRQLIRVKALSRMNSVEQNGDYTFSSFFSASESCRDGIKLEYLKFLRIAKDLADGAAKNAVFQMNFDLLKWS